ncbi:MAG: hypothetical protein C0413_02115 [Clostridiales bacterium]|nr:hypothetical protein [Clostridiales bacterium]
MRDTIPQQKNHNLREVHMIRNKKRVLALCVTLMMTLAFFSGCTKAPASTPAAGSDAAAPAAPAAPAEKVKLRVLLAAWDDVRKQMNSEYIEPTLQAKFPDYEFEFEEYVDQAKLNTYTATGDLPDVFFSGAMNSTLPVINSGGAEDLLPYITADGFAEKYSVKSLIEPWTDGKLYTISSGSDSYYTPRLYVNKSIFEQNGIAYPTTFDEFISVCQQFIDKGITPLTTHSFEGWAVNGFLWQTLAMAENPETVVKFYNGEIGFNDPAVVSAFSKIEQLAKMGAFPEGCAQMAYGETINLFKSKQVPMYMMFTWTLSEFETDEDVDFILFPSISPDVNMADYTQAWGGPLAGYAVSSQSKFKDAAVLVAEECAFQEALFFNKEQSALTGLDSGFEISNLSDLAQKSRDTFDSAANKLPSLTFIYSTKVVSELGIQAAKLMLGQATAQEVCDALEKVRLEG